MKELSIKELLEKAEEYNKNKITWHHHFLTKKCLLNNEDVFVIILENEVNGEAFSCRFKQKPMRELEKLEKLFFRRK